MPGNECKWKREHVIPGNDQNTIPTNQEATGNKLDRTSQLTFHGSRGHLKSFSGDFFWYEAIH